MADILILAHGTGSAALAERLQPELARRLNHSIRRLTHEEISDAALRKSLAGARAIILVLGPGTRVAGTALEAALLSAPRLPVAVVVTGRDVPGQVIPEGLGLLRERVVVMGEEQWDSALLQICALATLEPGLPKTATGRIARSALKSDSPAGIQRNSGFSRGAPPATRERALGAGVGRGVGAAPPETQERGIGAAAPAAEARPSAPAAATPSAPEPVLLGASAPRAVRPGDEFTARFVAYLKTAEQEVKATLASLSPRSEHQLGVKSCRWQPGTRVQVALAGRHLTVSPPAQEFTWEGDRQIVDFDVTVADAAPEGPVVLKFDALVDGIVVAMLRLDLEITRKGRDDRPAKASGAAARTAFASYSSKDRERVLDRVAAVRISAGLDIFLDCLSLHPSDEWKPQLAQAIRERDLFLLFWSQEAAQSKWVTWEWETALAQKGREALQIHPLETGVKPPEQLRDLHFGDVFMLIREAQEAKAARPPPGGSS